MKKLIIIFIIMIIAANGRPLPAQAAKPAPAEYLTKGDAIMLLSATDFMKKKVGELLSWTIGYDVSKVNRVRLTPSINYVKAVPKQIPPDGRTVLELQASVDDPGGLKSIAGVRADLSQIGRLPNTMLVDTGLFGDQTANDGVYTLQSTVATKVPLGTKDLTVAVANKKGWLALAKTSIEVKKNPTIIETKVLAGEGALVTITVKVDNPGRLEDIQSVSADLGALQLESRAPLVRSETSDIWQLEINIPSQVSAGSYTIPILVSNYAGGWVASEVKVTVNK